MGRSLNACGARTRKSGFTLIELTAVLAAAGTIGAIAAPFGGILRGASREATSADLHRGISKQQLLYTNENAGFFAGPNSSGFEFNRRSINGPGNPFVPTVFGDTTSDTPTNVGDWLSPILGADGRLPANRALRTAAIFDQFGDPTADRFVDLLFGAGNTGDADDFVAVLNSTGIRQSSFLQPRSFGNVGSDFRSTELDLDRGFLQIRYADTSGVPATIPNDYVPSIDRVGAVLSGKVMFADGTRFLSEGNILDHDMSDGVGSLPVSPFTSTGPIFESSVAYGRSDFGSPDNLDLSFRKKNGDAIFASMFDGSLRVFTRQQAWTDPTPWYPTGSVWTGSGATSESAQWVKKNLPGGVLF